MITKDLFFTALIIVYMLGIVPIIMNVIRYSDVCCRAGIIVQPGAWWLGVHYSTEEKRFCINVIPCVTLWVALPSGRVPKKSSLFYWGIK